MNKITKTLSIAKYQYDDKVNINLYFVFTFQKTSSE